MCGLIGNGPTLRVLVGNPVRGFGYLPLRAPSLRAVFFSLLDAENSPPFSSLSDRKLLRRLKEVRLFTVNWTVMLARFNFSPCSQGNWPRRNTRVD